MNEYNVATTVVLDNHQILLDQVQVLMQGLTMLMDCDLVLFVVNTEVV
jgi:hypothetical protein